MDVETLSETEGREVAHYEDLRSYANRMVWTIELQIGRLREFSADPDSAGDFVLQAVSDAEVLVVSLQRLRLAACRVNKMTGSSFPEELVEYDKELPNLRTARNKIAHLDEYILGDGKDKSVPRQRLFVHGFGTNELDFTGYKFQLDKALSAAQRLFSAIQAKPPASYTKAVRLQRQREASFDRKDGER